MKLPNFREDNGMNNLRAIIGANLNINYEPASSWNPMVLKLIQDGELGNLNLNDVSIGEDGTLEYGGVKIVVYIRDQSSSYFNSSNNTSSYKFHFYNCATISGYRKEGKFDGKYVVNTHKKFNINITDFGRIIKEGLELDLRVCRNCLNSFNYKGYKKTYKQMKDSIYNNFTREEYFEHFKSKVTIPKYNHLNKPMDIYAENWTEISLKAKERANYKCCDCGNTNNLQTHHKDHNKGNNSSNNLEVLCYGCHAKHHSHM